MKGVCNGGNEQPDDRGEAGLQLTSRPAWPVPEVFDRFFDSLDCRRTHTVRPAVQQIRDRADRSAGHGGHVADTRTIDHLIPKSLTPACGGTFVIAVAVSIY